MAWFLSPAMEAKGPKVLTYMQELQALSLENAGLDVLLKIAQTLPDLVQSLMPGTTDELVETFAVKVNDLFQGVKNTDVNLQKLMDVMTEATSALPLDAHLSELAAECGKLVEHKGQQALQARLCKMAEDITWKQDSDVQVFFSNCQTWGAELKHCTLSEQTLKKNDMGVFKVAVVNICTAVAELMQDEAHSMESLTQCLNTASQALRVVPNTAMESDVDMIQSGLALQKILRESSLDDGTPIDNLLLLRCGELGRLVQQTQKKDGVLKQKEDIYLQSTRGLITKALDHVSKLSNTLRDQTKEVVEKAIYELEPICGGQAAGKKWMETEILEWEPFMTHAKETIMKMDANLLDTLLNTANEAKHKKNILICFPPQKERQLHPQ
eukprot:3449492-Amphidinium_carterae.1